MKFYGNVEILIIFCKLNVIFQLYFERVVDTGVSEEHSILSTISNGSLIWGTALCATSCTIPKGHVLISLRSTNQKELQLFTDRITTPHWSMSFQNYDIQSEFKSVGQRKFINCL